MTTVWPDQAVCECGDYRHQHYDEIGKCRVCGDGSAPYDGCKRYRPTCAHLSATGIDRAPCDDQKVWECDSCSWRYRSVRQLDGTHRMSAEGAP